MVAGCNSSNARLTTAACKHIACERRLVGITRYASFKTSSPIPMQSLQGRPAGIEQTTTHVLTHLSRHRRACCAGGISQYNSKRVLYCSSARSRRVPRERVASSKRTCQFSLTCSSRTSGERIVLRKRRSALHSCLKKELGQTL